jgi:hypothetical protein
MLTTLSGHEVTAYKLKLLICCKITFYNAYKEDVRKTKQRPIRANVKLCDFHDAESRKATSSLPRFHAAVIAVGTEIMSEGC